MKFIIITFALLVSFNAHAKEKYSNKPQQVNFEGSEVDGQVRTPDGAYLVQKRGAQFMPLYDVKKQFDKDIKDSADYLR